jgi:sodium pump decarboxylase gamma subunit
MTHGILLTVIGMGTVFVSLILLAVIMTWLYAIVAWQEKPAAAKAEQPAVRPQAEGATQGEGEELFPVIAAAIGAYLEAESTLVFLVPVLRPDRSGWVMDGRLAALSRRDRS